MSSIQMSTMPRMIRLMSSKVPDFSGLLSFCEGLGVPLQCPKLLACGLDFSVRQVFLSNPKPKPCGLWSRTARLTVSCLALYRPSR